MGDIKLIPRFWGHALGPESTQQAVGSRFGSATCSLLVAPPHTKNPAVQREYEKAGGELYAGIRSWHNNEVMEPSHERYETLGNEHEHETT